MTRFGEHLRAIMAIDPDAVAIVEREREYRWGELATAVAAIDAVLSEAGIGGGHRVRVLIRNRASSVAAMLPLFTSGVPWSC